MEEWRPIVGSERYEVSNLGRIRSTRIMRPRNSQGGYQRIIFNENGKVVRASIHRLVAEAFVENPEGKPEVNHIDGRKGNNVPENLEWATRAENCRHALELGLAKPLRGEAHGFSVLKEREVLDIHKRLAAGERPSHLARRYGVWPSAVTAIKYGRTWGWLTGRGQERE